MESKMKSVARLSAAKLVLYAGTGFAGILLARLLGPTDYGTVAIVMSIVGILGVISDMNLSSAAVKFGSEKGARKEDYVTTAFLLRGAIGLAGLIAFTLLAKPLAARYGFPPSFLTLVALGYFLQSPMALRALWSIEHRFNLMALVEGSTGIIYFAIMILLAYFYRLNGVFYAIVVISLFIGTSSLLKITPGKFDKTCLNRMLPYSFFAMLFSLFTYVSQNYDKIILGAYVAKEQLGYYALAYKAAYFLMFVPLAVQAVVFPSFSELASKKDYRGIRRLLKKTVTSSLAYALVGALALVGIFHFLVNFFLTKYAAAGPYLPFILLPFVLDASIGSTCNVMLSGMNRIREVAAIAFTQAILMVLIGNQLVKTNGVWGVVASLWIAYTISSALYLWRVRVATAID